MVATEKTAPVIQPAGRWFWNREVRIFLIHYSIWVAFSLIGGWLELRYIPTEQLKESAKALLHFQNDWAGYVRYTMIVDLAFLVPIHFTYWLYRVAANKRKTWALALFGLYTILHLFILSVITGLIYGALNIPYSSQEALSGVVFMWVYTLIFIGIRAYRQNQRRQRELELGRTRAELQALKAQVNPHFMFNTLNNLYGTALSGNTERTAAGIEQLSSVMRHMTEASQRDLIPVERELRFVEDTVDLHRMRVPDTDTICINTTIEWDEKPTQIVPLLLNPLIDNAFKYGISMQHPSVVDIQIRVADGILNSTIRNSIVPRTNLEKGTGMGLKNVRQRLALAYPNRHSLRIDEATNQFTVHLNITL